MSGNEKIKLSDYPTGGQLLLWATRHWVRAYRRGWMVPACVWQSFAAADLDLAYAELCRLLRIVAFRELDVREISRPSATRLSPVEQRFMSNFERVERFGSGVELEMLGMPATPAISRELLGATVAIVADLREHGHRIARPATAQNSRSSSIFDLQPELAWHH